MRMIFLALIVQCCINFASGQALVITRASHGRDAFHMPASICKRNGAQSGSDCKSFYAVDGTHDCSCMCPAKNATFAFHDRRWSCVENRKLRRHLNRGCDITTSFTGENADRRLPTLAFGGRREISLWFIFWPFWSCTINIRSSWFLGCRGWRIFLRKYQNAAMRLFTLSRRNSNAPYVLRVNNNIPGTDIFRGKIVNLVIDCRVTQTTQRVQFDSSCLRFKLEGNTTCPVPKTNITGSSTIHAVKTSSVMLSTSRIKASHSSVIQQNVSSAIISVTESHTRAIKPTISDVAPDTSSSHQIVTRFSTYLGSQPITTEISPTTSATSPAITEISATDSTSQPTISRGSTNWATAKISPTASTSKSAVSSKVLTNQATVSEILRISTVIQPTVSQMSPRASVAQPIVTKISPTTLNTQPSVSAMSPMAHTTQMTVIPVLLKKGITQPTSSETLLGAANTQAALYGGSPVVDNTQQLGPKISPTASDALSRASEVLPPVPGTQPTASKVSPTDPDTPPTDSETSETPPKDSDTSQTPRILLLKTPYNNQTALPSNAPPTLSEDRERSTDKGSSPVGLIVGIPITLIIIAAIVVSLVYRRRYSNKRLRSRSDTISEMTMDTLVMSPQINRAHPSDYDRASCNTLDSKVPHSHNASPFEIPEYDAPLSQINRSLEDEDKPCRRYAPADIVERDPGNTQAPFHYALEKSVTNQETPTDHVVEDNGREANNNNKSKEPMYYVLEGPYPEGVEENGKSGAIFLDKPEEPAYCTVGELFWGSSPEPNSEASNSSNDDPKCEDEPIYNVLERRYFQGSKIPAHYLQFTQNEQIFGSIKRPLSASNNQDNVPEDADEPVYDVLDRRYFGGSKVPAHYVQITSNGPIFSSSEVLYSDPSKADNTGPKCADEPVEKILEERYFDGSQVPMHYVRVSPKGVVRFSTLEKLYRNSRKASDYDPKCGSEPEGGNIVEQRYLEGSEVPKHYLKITPNGPVFATLEKLHRNSRKGPKSDPKCGNEPEGNIVEECYLEGSEVPVHYEPISPKDPVFNILERLYRDSVKGSKHDPECENEREGNIVEEHYLKGSELPSHYVQINPKDPVFNILEKLYRDSVKGSNDPKSGSEPGAPIEEERYLDGSEVPKHYVKITPKRPAFRNYEKLHRSSPKAPKYDPQCGKESEGKIVEERYLEGSDVPEHYEPISPNGPVFNILEKLYRDSIKESKNDSECANEPVDKTLEERYLGASEVPKHYVQITPNGLVFCTLERLHRNSRKGSKCDPKCGNESGDNIVEERYLAGSDVPEHYKPITLKNPVFNVLEKLYRNSVKESKHGPECVNEPVDKTLEERYLEGSEVPERYVQVTPKDPVFSILEKLYRDSVKGSKHDPERGSEPEDSIVEKRYLEGSEVPKHYVQITPNGLVFNTLEKSHRNSHKGSKCDPKSDAKRESESEGNIVEDRYLAGSELPSHYLQITPKSPVFNILEKSYRDSIRGSKHPEHGSEPEGSIVDGRYLEGSEVPKRYVIVTPKEPVFSTLESLHRNSRQGSKDDPKCGNDSGDKIVEERYLAGSEVPKHYVQVTPKDPVFNIFDKLYRNSRFKGFKRDPKCRKKPEGDIAEEGSKETTC